MLQEKRLCEAVYSFGLNRPYDWVTKMWREQSRCKHAKTSEDLRDACINFAITAWHVGDWVWAAIASESETRSAVGPYFGVTGKRLEKDDFIAWLVRKCPDLELCQGICNGSKHVQCGAAMKTGMTLPEFIQSGKQLVAKAEITDGSGQQDAIEVFERVMGFWTQQLLMEATMR